MAGIGVITVGNSGVGKSLLGNILLDKEAFVHDYSADSVTACVEAEVIVTGTDWGNVLIFNLPGLIEANSKKIERNKLELQKAFNNCSHQVVVYVFGHEGGRIRAEDVVAFVRFKQAYRISPESVLFVFNKASSKLNFEKKESSVFFARTQIAALLGSNECDSIPYVFLPNFGEQFHLSDSALNGYRQTLLSLIYSRTPRSYRLESELKFDWEEVHAVKKEMSILMESMEKQHETFLSTAAQMKAENERAVAEANRRTDEILAASARAQEQQRQQIEEYQRANSANLQNSLNSVGPLLTVAAAFVPEVSVPIMLMQQAMAAGINPTAPNRNQNWNPVNYLIPKPPPFAGAPLEIPSTPNCILS